MHRPIGTSVRRNTVQQHHITPRKRGEITQRRHTATTHTSSAVPCQRVQAPKLPPQRPVAVLLLLLLLTRLLLLLRRRLRTLWQQEKPSTSWWQQMTTTKVPRNGSTQSQALQSKVRASRRERELHHRVQTEGSSIHQAWARCGSTHSWIYIVEIAPGAISPLGAISPMGAISRMITVYDLFNLLCILSSVFICFPPEVIFRSRVIGACPVTTDCILAMSYVRTTTNNKQRLLYVPFSSRHGMHRKSDLLIRPQIKSPRWSCHAFVGPTAVQYCTGRPVLRNVNLASRLNVLFCVPSPSSPA